ncbi:hypothetical protein EX30DRAFT_173995 [Ascodesmis nigricans]|uniref:Uncharacterized protein n=1 Tax=Ascodesmis nigricans TaxID=341454 RepID=A0A4S2MRQ6_9PEZI|nr:hypothetical protein EX30DRAFT_173995 [Ascodesmis nigricans]
MNLLRLRFSRVLSAVLSLSAEGIKFHSIQVIKDKGASNPPLSIHHVRALLEPQPSQKPLIPQQRKHFASTNAHSLTSPGAVALSPCFPLPSNHSPPTT